MAISGLEKYINQVGADYDRSTGVSDNEDEWKKNFADVIVDDDVSSELARTAKVIADRVSQGLDTSAQETYKKQLLDAAKAVGGSNDMQYNSMETKKSTYGESYTTPMNETANKVVGAAGNFSIGDTTGFGNAINRVMGSVAAGMVAVGDGANPLVGAAKDGNEVVYVPTEGTTNWPMIALIGGGAIIVASFIKGIMD